MQRFAVIAFLLFLARFAFAGDVLSLHDCVRMGLEGNLTLQGQRIQLASASADVLRVSAYYDTRLQLDGSYHESDLPPGSFPAQGGLERGQATARMTRGLPSGTSLGVEFDFQRNLFEGMSPGNDPQYRTAAGITISQSLWRNAFGRGQQAQVEYVRRRLDSLALEYERARQEVAAAIADEYWRALTAHLVADTQAEVIGRLRKLRAYNQQLLEDGLLDESAVLAVDASLAVAEVDAEFLRHDSIALDEQLKERINLPVQRWDYSRIDYRLPDEMPEASGEDFLSIYEAARQHRGDVAALRSEEERVQDLIRWKEQEDRADLAISGSVGRGDTASRASDSFEFDQNIWSVGVLFDMSLGRSDTRAEVRQAMLEREYIRTEMEMLDRSIQLSCRAVLRQMATARRLVVATGQARSAQQRKLDLEVDRFRRGQSDTKTLLDYENDLDLAERDYLTARGALERARVAMLLATGRMPAGEPP